MSADRRAPFASAPAIYLQHRAQNQIVTSPRARKASLFSGQFVTAYFDLGNLPRRSALNLCVIGRYFQEIRADLFANFRDPCNKLLRAQNLVWQTSPHLDLNVWYAFVTISREPFVHGKGLHGRCIFTVCKRQCD